MNKNYTHISIVLDNSGSMHGLKEKTKKGLWDFIQEQKNDKKSTVTLVEFNTISKTIFDFENIEKIVEPHDFYPTGGTALFDALGTCIQQTGATLAKMKEEDRPGLVIFFVITDGRENSSLFFRRDDIQKMVSEQESKYNWKFVYLGANQDAFQEGTSMGFAGHNSYGYNANNIDVAFANTSSVLTRCRADVSANGVLFASSLQYTAEEIKSMNEGPDVK